MVRSANAQWKGDLQHGQGVISTQSKTLDNTAYSFKARFEDGTGTNPEELIAAAHAGCFSMAFAFALQLGGFSPESVTTDAKLTFEQVEGNWSITQVHLDTVVSVPGIEESEFQSIASDAKANCPISRALKVDISLTATLL